MKITRVIAIVFAVTMISCEYPYIFGTSINSKGIANGLGDQGITGAQTTAYGLDDVSQSVAYANGTKENNARAKGEAIFTPKLHGANTNADAINNGIGNSLADSVSKSFNPYKKYYDENYKDYINFLNALFMKYPEKRQDIVKIVLKYADKYNNKNMNNDEEDSDDKKDDVNVKMIVKEKDMMIDNKVVMKPEVDENGYPVTIANYNNPNFKAIGQTTFDYQRARGSGLQTAASTNSGTFRWNQATVHQGDAVGNARQGWATSSSNDYGLGKVNYVNSEQNAGANGDNAQTNSASNYYLANNAVWNNGENWGRAEGKDSLAFSNLNGNSYGYGAVNGNTNAYTDGNLAVSKSMIKGAPHFPK